MTTNQVLGNARVREVSALILALTPRLINRLPYTPDGAKMTKDDRESTVRLLLGQIDERCLDASMNDDPNQRMLGYANALEYILIPVQMASPGEYNKERVQRLISTGLKGSGEMLDFGGLARQEFARVNAQRAALAKLRSFRFGRRVAEEPEEPEEPIVVAPVVQIPAAVARRASAPAALGRRSAPAAAPYIPAYAPLQAAAGPPGGVPLVDYKGAAPPPPYSSGGRESKKASMRKGGSAPQPQAVSQKQRSGGELVAMPEQSVHYMPTMPRVSDVVSSSGPCLYEQKVTTGDKGYWQWMCERSSRAGPGDSRLPGLPSVKKCVLHRVEDKRSVVVPVNCLQEYVNVLKGFDVDKVRYKDTVTGDQLVSETITPDVDTYGSARITGQGGPPIPYKRLQRDGETEADDPLTKVRPGAWSKMAYASVGGASAAPAPAPAAARRGGVAPSPIGAKTVPAPAKVAATAKIAVVSPKTAGSAPKAVAPASKSAIGVASPVVAKSAGAAPKIPVKTAGNGAISVVPPQTAGTVSAGSNQGGAVNAGTVNAGALHFPSPSAIRKATWALTDQDLDDAELNLPRDITAMPPEWEKGLDPLDKEDQIAFYTADDYGSLRSSARQTGFDFSFRYLPFEFLREEKYLEWLVSLDYNLRAHYPDYHFHKFDPVFSTIATVESYILTTLRRLEEKYKFFDRKTLFAGAEPHRNIMHRYLRVYAFAPPTSTWISPISARYAQLPAPDSDQFRKSEAQALGNVRDLNDKIGYAANSGKLAQDVTAKDPSAPGQPGIKIPLKYKKMGREQDFWLGVEGPQQTAENYNSEEASDLGSNPAMGFYDNRVMGIVEDELLSMLARLQYVLGYVINTNASWFTNEISDAQDGLMDLHQSKYLTRELNRYLATFQLEDVNNVFHRLPQLRMAQARQMGIPLPKSVMGSYEAQWPHDMRTAQFPIELAPRPLLPLVTPRRRSSRSKRSPSRSSKSRSPRR
jgi:hypothetical protein